MRADAYDLLHSAMLRAQAQGVKFTTGEMGVMERDEVFIPGMGNRVCMLGALLLGKPRQFDPADRHQASYYTAGQLLEATTLEIDLLVKSFDKGTFLPGDDVSRIGATLHQEFLT